MTNVDTDLRLTRLLGAPRERVWQAWTAPEGLARWWWPERFQTTYEVDLRQGGRYHFRTVDLPDIGVLSLAGTFLEVSPPERLEYTWRWEQDLDTESQVTAEFAARGGQTDVHVVHTGLVSTQDRDNHILGWNDCLDRLARMYAD